MKSLAYFASMAMALSLCFVNCSKNDFSAVPNSPSSGPNSSPNNVDTGGGHPNTTSTQGMIDPATPTGGNGTPGSLSQGDAANGNVAGGGGSGGGSGGGGNPAVPPAPGATPPPGSVPTPGSTPIPGGPTTTYGNGVPEPQAALQIPTITYYAPKCKAGDWCPVTFRIAGGGATLNYNWSTNDSKFGQTPPAGLAPYGQAGVDYVSTYGSMTWEKGGVDSIVIYIHDISKQAGEITIPLLFTNCVYAGHPINCTDLKFTGVQQ